LLLGHIRDLERDALGFLMSAVREYGDVVRLRFAWLELYLVTRPRHVQQVLETRQASYDKHTLDHRMLEPVLGRGLLVADGEGWARQRHRMDGTFHHARLAGCVGTIVACTEAMLAWWEGTLGRDEPLDIAAEMSGLTRDILIHAIFGPVNAARAEALGSAVSQIDAEIAARGISPRALFSGSRMRTTRRMRPPLNTLELIVREMTEIRRHTPGDDLLSAVLEGRADGNDEGMVDAEIRDEIVTLLVAGHAPLTNALTWAFYLLSTYAQVGRRLRAEVSEVIGWRTPGIEDLAHLRYARMILEEALRLYPPTWAITRRALVDDEIGGFHIPAGAIVLVSPYVTHRHPGAWENPEAFDPGRFESECVATRPPYAYFPFGGGPRRCLGESFALMAATIVLATVSRQYSLALVPGHTVVPEPGVALAPRDGLPMTVHRAV
jgi:cytochrome P450